MTMGAVGPLSNLAAPMRPSGRPGGPAAPAAPAAPTEGPARTADVVEVPSGTDPLARELREMTEAVGRLSAGPTDELRSALVALENIRSASTASAGALEGAAEELSAPGAGGGAAGSLPPQRPGLIAPEPQRVLQLLGG